MNTYEERIRGASISALLKPFIAAAGIVLTAGTLALGAESAPPVKPADPVVTPAAKEWGISVLAWRGFQVYIRREDETQETKEPIGGMSPSYGCYSFRLQTNRLYYLRFEPLDYVFARLGEWMLKIQGADHHWPGEGAILLALPVPPGPFCVADIVSGESHPEVHSLAEFKAAQGTVWLVNKDEKSDSKLYIKARKECAVLMKDPALQSVCTILSPQEGETLSGPVNFIAGITEGTPLNSISFNIDSLLGSADTALITYPPYRGEIDTTQLSNGRHEVEAAVFRSRVKSRKVSFKVDNTLPAVFLVNGKYHNNEWPRYANSPGFNWAHRQISGTVPVEAGVLNLAASKVAFLVDSILKETDASSPYAFSVDTTSLKDGFHAFAVKAYDAAGKLAASRTEKVLVVNNSQVTITAPAAGATVSGSVVAMASVLKDIPYRWLMFEVDGVYQGEDNLVRHEPPLGICIDTTKLSDGLHEIEAYQGLGRGGPDYIFSGKVAFTVDNSRPAVFLTHQARFEAPWPGRMISGTVPVAAGVANMKAVGKVEFLVDEAVKETDASSPYGANLDTTKLSEGPHDLTLKAYDAAGKLAATQTTKVVVCNNGAISILAPVAGKPVSGTITALASVPEELPVRWLQFKVDGVEQGEDNLIGHAAPFGLCLDTAKLGNGPHVLDAVAGYGPLIGGWRVGSTLQQHSPQTGRYLYSEKVSFTVDNSMPAVFLTHQERFEAPWPGRTVSGTVAIEARVANLKAGKVEFLVDGTLKGTDASSLDEKRKAYLAQIDAAQRALSDPEAQAAWEQSGPLADPWWSVGPYQAASAHEAFVKDFAPEHGIDLTQPTSDGKTWVQHNEPEWQDGLNIWLVKPYAQGDNTASYVYRVINARAATTLPLSLGSDDTITVWLNGKQVLAHEVTRTKAAADQEKLSIELRPGVNTLLMKITNVGHYSGFYFKAKAPLLEAPLEISTILLLPAAQRSAAQSEQVAAYYGNTAPALAEARRHLAELQQRFQHREKDPTQWPYSASIDTTKLTEGAHELTVKAYDAAGKLAASQTIKVTVTNAVKGGVK